MTSLMDNHPVALITGASRGIGKAIAVSLGKAGYQLALISKTQPGSDAVRSELAAIPDCLPPRLFTFDITQEHEVARCIQKITDEFGRIDILVNNAGIYFSGSATLSVDDFRKMTETNLIAQHAFLIGVIPVMKKQQKGYIFNIASRAGKTGLAREGGYSATKFGLVGLNEALYRELAADGISVTAICPGWVHTDMAIEAGSNIPPEKMIHPEDIVKSIHWILSLSEGCRIREIILEPSINIL